MKAAHPELDAANIINRVVSTARDRGAPGPDPIYGFGLIDAQAAVGATVPRVDANPMGDLQDWITLYRRAEATSSPLPSAAPSPSPIPGTAGPQNPLGTLLPTVNLLRNVGIPLAVVAVFLALAASATVVGVRRFWAGRRTR